MTIKEFSRLCGCHPQTLRYYDRIQLLKPVRTDPWSGYRFYEKEQALLFVKIKNLQKAGFTIEEIRELLKLDDPAICLAFDAKIREAENQLQQMRAIRRSYQTEMEQVQDKLRALQEEILQDMQLYDPAEEFGLDARQYAAITNGVNDFFADILTNGKPEAIAFEDAAQAGPEEAPQVDPLHDPAYTVFYEAHGWKHAREFWSSWPTLAGGTEYLLYFQVTDAKGANHTAFANTVLGLLLASDPQKKWNLSCRIVPSTDGQNHIWIMQRR